MNEIRCPHCGAAVSPFIINYAVVGDQVFDYRAMMCPACGRIICRYGPSPDSVGHGCIATIPRPSKKEVIE